MRLEGPGTSRMHVHGARAVFVTGLIALIVVMGACRTAASVGTGAYVPDYGPDLFEDVTDGRLLGVSRGLPGLHEPGDVRRRFVRVRAAVLRSLAVEGRQRVRLNFFPD